MKKCTAFIIALVLSLLCSCSGKGGGESAPDSSKPDKIKEIMSEADELNETKADTYAALPDGIDLDDTEHARVLEADKEGNITYERLGVSFHLPDGYTAYIYEHDPKEGVDEEMEDDPEYNPEPTNLTCEAAIFLLGPNFPYSSEFIRLTYFTRIAIIAADPEMVINETHQPFKEINTYADYMEALRSDMDHLKPYIIFNEGLDKYNYVDLEDTEIDNIMMYLDDDLYEKDYNSILGCDETMVLNRATAPDSDLGEISCEDCELDNGSFGLKLDYYLRRKGIDMDKQVYWLYREGVKVMQRVEFSKDKGAKMTADEKSFIESLDFFEPVCENKYAVIDYFNHFKYSKEDIEFMEGLR